MEYLVRPFDDEIIAAYARLFPGDSSKSPDLLRWRFERNPHGKGSFAVAVDPESGGAIVGMIGLIATQIRCGDRLIRGVQAIDTVVDPAYRGRGLFTGMGAAAQDRAASHGASLIWGFPNANAAPGWFGKLGWTRVGMVPFLARPLRSGYVLGRIFPALRRVDFPLVQRARRDVSIRAIERFTSSADGFWAACRSGMGCGVDRSAAMLNWRLFDRPGTPYRVHAIVAPDGSLVAICAHCVLDKHGGRIAYIMEALALPGREADLAQLIRAILSEAAGEGAEVALAWCGPGAPSRSAYRGAGFLPLPERLRPIEIHFGMRPLAPEAEAGSRGADWYLSYLDSDTV